MGVNFIKKYQNLNISKSGNKSEQGRLSLSLSKIFNRKCSAGWMDVWMGVKAGISIAYCIIIFKQIINFLIEMVY